MSKRIFLDYASSTPVSSLVMQEMNKWSKKNFANPSALYKEAREAKDSMQKAREKIASFMNCTKDEIFFTSCGTESDNLALLGIFNKFKSEKFTPHIIVSSTEHPAILEVCEEIKRKGGEVTIIPVSSEGLVSAQEILKAIKRNTVLVSIMQANNEIGTIQPIKEIGRVIKKYRSENKTSIPYFHTDSCQAVLYEKPDTASLCVDLMTLDGIKMYGPKGVGILYVKSGTEINSILFGGGQEKSLRSGTENVCGIIGLAKAFEEADKIRERESKRLSLIRDYAISKLYKNFPDGSLNGSLENRLPNNVNFCFKNIDAEFLVVALDVKGISVSYSSACKTLSENSNSYVIESLGKKECSSSSLRITMGRDTSKKHIDFLIKSIMEIINNK